MQILNSRLTLLLRMLSPSQWPRHSSSAASDLAEPARYGRYERDTNIDFYLISLPSTWGLPGGFLKDLISALDCSVDILNQGLPLQTGCDFRHLHLASSLPGANLQLETFESFSAALRHAAWGDLETPKGFSSRSEHRATAACQSRCRCMPQQAPRMMRWFAAIESNRNRDPSLHPQSQNKFAIGMLLECYQCARREKKKVDLELCQPFAKIPNDRHRRR